MGIFGTHSCQSDSVWDNLHAKNIHRMTSREVKDTLQKFVDENPLPWDWSSETFDMLQTYIGVVTHILFQGLHVPKSHLERAFKIVGYFLDPEYTTWKTSRSNPEEKLSALREEQEAIIYALAHKCRGKVKRIKGLLEQMEDVLGGGHHNRAKRRI